MPRERASSRNRTSDDGVIARAGRATESAEATNAYLDLSAKLVEMQVQLAAINEKLTGLPDHEARIRDLEAAKAKLLGACLLLGTLAGGASGWLALVMMHH